MKPAVPMWCSIGLILMLHLSTITFAEKPNPAVTQDEMVVTATRTETEVDKAPASVSKVTMKDLEKLTFDRLDDAIRYEVGVYDGKLRGMPSGNQTLVMLNGMPLNSGWFGGTRWKNIAIDNVERIEIVRGPGSALYGGNAMGGAINIITRLPDAFEAGIQSKFGSDDNLSYGGYVGDRIADKFSIRLGFEIDEEIYGYPTNYVQRTLRDGDGDLSGGFFMPTRTDDPAWIVGDQGDRMEDQWNVNFATAVDLTDTGSIRLDGQVGSDTYAYDTPHTYLNDTDGNPAFSGTVNAGNARYASVSESNYLSGSGNETNQSYMATYTETFGPTSFIGKLGFQHEDKWYTTPEAASGEDYTNAGGNVKEFDTDTYFADLQISFGIGARNFITTGLYGRTNGFTQEEFDVAYYRDEDSKISGVTNLTEGKDRYFAVYAQDEITIIEDLLTAYIGGRFDYWEAFDGLSGDPAEPIPLEDIDNSAFNPKLSLVWQPVTDTTIKGSVGKAFRAPTIYDLYRTYEGSSGMIYSNPDLDPETLWNYEIGMVHYFLTRMIRTEVTLFQADIDNLIYTYNDEEGDSYKDNAGEARIRGIELSTEIIPWEFLSLWANYTYNNAEITKQEKDPEMEGKTITGMPDQIVNIGTDLTYGWFRASLVGRYLGRIYNTKYNEDIPDVYKADSKTWLWDAKLTATLPVESVYLKDIKLSLSVENLFDEEYYAYEIGRERSYFAEVQLNW